MYPQLTTFLTFFLLSCTEPSINEIKQPVFGGLHLGVSTTSYLKTIDSLYNSNQILLTKNSKFPYFSIDNSDIASTKKLLIFPNAIYNDTIVTKIIYYLYQIDIPSSELLERANSADQNTMIEITRGQIEKYTNLTENFKLLIDRDNSLGCRIPNMANGSLFDIYPLHKELTDLLNSKYGLPNEKDTVGSRHNSDDFSYYEKYTWKNDNINISLLHRRLPSSSKQVNDMYHILVYEFNSETIKKYNLNRKASDLKNTF